MVRFRRGEVDGIRFISFCGFVNDFCGFFLEGCMLFFLVFGRRYYRKVEYVSSKGCSVW